jgi:hypothetical protein
VKVPIVVSCECGRATDADAGDEVTCGCGRRYRTELSPEQRSALNAMQQRSRAFARLGIGVVGMVALVAMLGLGVRGGAVVLALGVVAWWVLLQRVWRQRVVRRIAGLPPATIRPM